MRSLVQRVSSASVEVAGETVGRIGPGVLVFVGVARSCYEGLVDRLKAEGMPVATGVFQAAMQVALVNDGPVSILLDSRRLF